MNKILKTFLLFLLLVSVAGVAWVSDQPAQKASKASYMIQPTIQTQYYNGIQQYQAQEYEGLSTVSSGVATFNLTTDGTSTGTAIFTTIENVNFTINDSANQYEFSWTLSANKKVMTVTANKLGTVILGIIQFTSAANGASIQALIKGV